MINVDRSSVTAPEVTTNHRTLDILKALEIVFLGKCYICEKSLPHPNFFQVDHFIPKNEDPTLEYEWTNLYLCCIDCNISRKRTTPIGGYLDPCLHGDNVEQEIIYSLPSYEHNEPLFTPRNKNPSKKIINTIQQLKRLHYGTTQETKVKCAAFREVIAKQASKLITKIAEENKALKIGDRILADQRAQEIENMIDCKAPFTMLLRDIVKRIR